jgi:HlyD family secretion protein
MATHGKFYSGKWAGLGVGLLVFGGLAFSFVRSHADTGPRYTTQKVQRGDLVQTVTATGTLNPVLDVTVGSQVSGRICKLYVDYNSMVKSNQIIAEIDPSTYQAAFEQASADLANAKANEELQQVEATRSSQLFTNKLISQSDYDTALATLHEAQATVQIKEASLRNAEANLGYCKILSPINGIVISRAVELGQTVASSFSTPTLFQIANDLTRMQIDTSVDESDIGGIKQGQPVDFTVGAYPNRTFHGVVTQVRNAPTTLNNVVTYDTVIGVTNSDYSLKPGMTANVSIVVARHQQVLEIPNAALRFEPLDTVLVETNTIASGTAALANSHDHEPPRSFTQKSSARGARDWSETDPFHTIFILRPGAQSGTPTLEAVQVTTGVSDNIQTEVLSGLKEGDQVVTGLMIPDLASGTKPRNPFSMGHHF